MGSAVEAERLSSVSAGEKGSSSEVGEVDDSQCGRERKKGASFASNRC